MPADNSYNIITNPGSSDVEVKKSHFLGALRRVSDEEEARAFIEEIRKEHYDARHHCFAMRIGAPDQVYERFSDDGEPQGTAGKPMLEILKGSCLTDVCAVVTRYFGGTLLGTGGLVRAYSDALKEAVSASETAAVRQGRLMEVACDYQTASKVRRLASNADCPMVKDTYDALCTLTYLVPAEDAERFAKDIVQLSAGQCEAAKAGEVLYYGTDRPVIYKEA